MCTHKTTEDKKNLSTD